MMPASEENTTNAVQRQLAGQLMQMPCGVDLGPQHRVDALGGQRADDSVVEHTGGVHHRL